MQSRKLSDSVVNFFVTLTVQTVKIKSSSLKTRRWEETTELSVLSLKPHTKLALRESLDEVTFSATFLVEWCIMETKSKLTD